MNTYIDIDGIVVDEETGEIIDSPGGDYLSHLASAFLDADEALKEWERKKRTIARVFLREQEAPKAVYGDVVVSIPRPGSHMEFDYGAWALWVATEEMTTDELRYWLARSKPDYSQFPPGPGRDQALSFYTSVPHAAYAKPSRVLKRANMRVVERKETDHD